MGSVNLIRKLARRVRDHLRRWRKFGTIDSAVPAALQASPRTAALLCSTVVWDNHGCMPLRVDDSFLPQLERYRKAGVTVVSLNAGFAKSPWTEHLRVLSFMRQWIARRPDVYRLIVAADDAHVCKREGKLGIVFDVEGMCPVEDNLSLTRPFMNSACAGC